MRDRRLGFMCCIQNKGSHCSPQDRVEGGSPLPGDFRVIVCPSPPQMIDFCDLLCTQLDATVSKIGSVKRWLTFGQVFSFYLEIMYNATFFRKILLKSLQNIFAIDKNQLLWAFYYFLYFRQCMTLPVRNKHPFIFKYS